MKEKLKPTKADKSLAIARGVLGGIPFAGGLASELFNLVITPALTKRRNEWMESIAEGLREMEEKVAGFKIEELSKNEMFITTVMQASQAAVRNHQKEKLEALRNAVLNAALPNAPEEELQMIFLNFADTLTTWHMRILKFFDNPEIYIKEANINIPDWEEISPIGVFFHLYPRFHDQSQIFNLMIQDLADIRELLSEDKIRERMKKMAYLRISHTTTLGKQFIKFITSPIGEEEKSE
jgi:hypothetical protein